MFSRVLGLSVLAAIGVATLMRVAPPADVDAKSAWSGENAARHLAFIASAPRQIGSEHHRAVHDYLISEFASLGLEISAQDTVVAMPMLHRLPTRVRNVAARVHGTAGRSEAIALAAHYDTTRAAAAPGAGDDGAAVAALLEVARVLASDPPRHDVIFLITDGEEMGLLGARAFVKEQPWRGDVAVVLNFEARGTRGPSIMFEISGRSSELVAAYAATAPHPVTSSLSADVYRLMPNKTDFTVFRDEGMFGLNFAFIGGYADYHKITDDIAHLDPRSMRHHGVQALALVRALDKLDLIAARSAGDSIYFNLFPGASVIQYPAGLAKLLALLAAAVCALATGLAWQRGLLTARGLWWGSAAVFGSVLLTVAISWLTVRYLPALWRDRHAEACFAGVSLLAIVVTIAAAQLTRRKCRIVELLVIALIVWSLTAGATSVFLRSASYIFTWPAMFASLGLLAWLIVGRGIAVIWTFAAIPMVLLITPMALLTFLAFRVRLAPFTVVIVVMAAWLLVPLFRRDYSAVSAGGGV